MIFRRLAAHWFDRSFRRLHSGMTPSEVRAALGNPSKAEQEAIPSGSVFGLQDCFAHKMAPGDPCLQWLFRKGDRHFIVFFAQGNMADEWKLTWKVSYPSVVDDL